MLRVVKNFHNLELRRGLRIGLGKLEGNWKGKITAMTYGIEAI